MALSVVILAAGKGTRMKSALPKVLHAIAGKPMLQHVVDCANELGAENIYAVVGHGADAVKQSIQADNLHYVMQMEQHGTGHAVMQAMPEIDNDDDVLVLYGDVPLIQKHTLEQLVSSLKQADVGLLTVELADPAGYGRIVRNKAGDVLEIIEQKDASDDILKIQEGNTGILAARAKNLKNWLSRITSNNAQGEYYLTDVIALCNQDKGKVHAIIADNEMEVTGINDRIQLARLERQYQRKLANKLMQQGVTLIDPERLDIRGPLECENDIIIDVNCVFEGRNRIARNVHIGPNCVIKNAILHENVVIKAHTVIEDAEVGAGSLIGPFARLRPETRLAENTHIGNFVEIKKSDIGQGSKVNHLSYVGDSEVGSGVNIGAGTITCNYDGANKHKTIIGDNAFIGSDTQLVAPVTVGAGATIGAGSTITKDTPANELTLSRSKQVTIPGWARPTKNK